MPGGVVVVDEGDLVGDLAEHSHMLLGEGSSLSGDGVGEAASLQPYAVDLPFADDDLVVR